MPWSLNTPTAAASGIYWEAMKRPTNTHLDKARLSLPKSYLAAVGRHFGRDTVSGWVMSHGGLLPEEVVIPAVDPHPLPLSRR